MIDHANGGLPGKKKGLLATRIELREQHSDYVHAFRTSIASEAKR